MNPEGKSDEASVKGCMTSSDTLTLKGLVPSGILMELTYRPYLRGGEYIEIRANGEETLTNTPCIKPHAR